MIRTFERFDFKLTLLVIFLCLKCFISCGQMITLPDDLVSDLYLKYVEAVSNDKENVSLRRLFKNDKQYEIHIKKLKEVNGFKVHNLMIKENLRTGPDPLIYINNPVESKIPKAFLTLEEFKNVLTNRVMKQREDLTTKPKINLNKRKPNKKTTKPPLEVTILKKLASIDINKENNIKLATNIELVTNSTDTLTTETVMTTVYKNFTNIVKNEESMQNTKQQLEEPSTDTKQFSGEITATTVNLDVTKKITDQTENITVSVSAIDVTKQLITTLENITEKDLETTEIDIFNVTDNNTKQLDIVVADNTDSVTTDIQTLRDETVKIEVPTEKEKPKRKSTIKLFVNSEASKKITKQRKRSTLGRPLVFMGKQ